MCKVCEDMRTIGLGHLLGAYILFRALPVCPLCPAIRINGMSPGNAQTTRHGMKGKDMIENKKTSELFKLAKEDQKIMNLWELFDRYDNGPWWDFSQLIDCELALLELDKCIPSAMDENRIDFAYDVIDSCACTLHDHVNKAYREVFGTNSNIIFTTARKVALALK